MSLLLQKNTRLLQLTKYSSLLLLLLNEFMLLLTMAGINLYNQLNSRACFKESLELFVTGALSNEFDLTVREVEVKGKVHLPRIKMKLDTTKLIQKC